MGVNAISAIGHGDEDKKTSYTTDTKRKLWKEIDIGGMINGFGSMVKNLEPGNSIFTSGSNVQGAFGD